MAPLREIMTGTPFTVPAESSVSEAAQAMVKGRIGSAIVMQGAWLGGIFTERDVLRAAASGTDLTSSTVAEWMTKDPVTAPPDMDSEEAAQIMLSSGFRHLPVVDGRDVVGIVSLRDILSTRIGRPSA